jgi:hypothetical protein
VEALEVMLIDADKTTERQHNSELIQLRQQYDARLMDARLEIDRLKSEINAKINDFQMHFHEQR